MAQHRPPVKEARAAGTPNPTDRGVTMNQTDPTAAVWVDGDPLMEAIAAAVWEHCGTDECASVTVDDPRNIAAVAAAVARAAASAVVSPPTDRAELRDRIRHVLCEHDGKGYLWGTDMLEPDEYGEVADAVLAVLPEQADRAAVARVRALHQQYTFGDGTTDYCAHCNQIRGGWVPWPCPTVRALDVELAVDAQSCRWEHPHPGYQCEPRTVVEAHDTGTQQQVRPARGDQFEAWLKAQRDAAADYPEAYQAADGLLDLYRLHADMGVPLGGHVCEAQVVGDCECLEPAPAAQPDRPFRDEPTEVLQAALDLANTHAQQAARFRPQDQDGALPAVAELFQAELQHREGQPPADQAEDLVHVGWWCWRGDNHGHLATMACRSDNVPIHVPAEWADEMRAVIQRIEDGDDD